MVAGFERYFQIARALRDEDQRGDRQPEHTQLDLEMSYTTQDEILDLIEGLYSEIVEHLTQKRLLARPFPRLTYAEAMDRFGTDKPDIRFGLELHDISQLASESEFKVFKGAVESGGSVRGIAVGGLGDLTRRELDELTAVATSGGARGLAHFMVQSDDLNSPVAKFSPTSNGLLCAKRSEPEKATGCSSSRTRTPSSSRASTACGSTLETASGSPTLTFSVCAG